MNFQFYGKEIVPVIGLQTKCKKGMTGWNFRLKILHEMSPCVLFAVHSISVVFVFTPLNVFE